MQTLAQALTDSSEEKKDQSVKNDTAQLSEYELANKETKETSTDKPHKFDNFVKNSLSGKNKFGEKTPEFKDTIQRAQYWMNNFKKPDDIPNKNVPDNYDFRNLNGYDFTGPLRDQAECGSCYTMGFI